MEPRNTETRWSQQYEDGRESLFKSPTLSQLHSFSSTDDSCLYSCDCEENCTECNYSFTDMSKRWRTKKACAVETKFRKRIEPLLPFPPRERKYAFAKTQKTNDTLAKLKSELSKNYCPYSSDNCGCSSGCTDCDYGLHTYTTKNKSKLKSKVKEPHVKSSSGFRQLKTSERSRKPAKSFSTVKVLRNKKKAKLLNKKVLESCYPESSGSYDCKSDYTKRDSKKYTTTNRILKIKKKISRKLKTTTVKTRKLLGNKKVLKNTPTKVSKKDFAKNWFPDSSNSYDSDCKKHENTMRKRMKNRSQRTRASTNLNMSKLYSLIVDESDEDM